MLKITLLNKHYELLNALKPNQLKNLILNLLSDDKADLDAVTSLARTSILSDNNQIDLQEKQIHRKKAEIAEKRRIAGSLGGKKTQEKRKLSTELSTKSSKIKQNQAKQSICFPPKNPLLSSQVININNNTFNAHLEYCQRVSIKSENERSFLIFLHGDLFLEFYEKKEREAYLEIIDTLIEAIYQARSEKGLFFKQKHYFLKEMMNLILNIDFQHPRMQNLIKCLISKNEIQIKNSPFYIFGAIVNASEEIEAGITNFFGGEKDGKCKI